MIGHLVACYGAADRYLGMLAATLGESDRAPSALRAGAWSSTGAMGAATWLAHTAYEYGRLLLRARPRRPRARGARCSARPRRSPSASAMPALLGRIRRSARPTPAAALPDGLSPREVADPRLVAGGLSNREIGERAVDQRAHRRQPRPQHPAQDRLREPHRGRRPTPTATAWSIG